MKSSSRSGALAGFWFAAASLVALQAGAQSTAEYDRLGPYLMLGEGYSFENFDFDSVRFDFEDDLLDVEFPLRFDGSPNVIAHVGWRFHPHAAVDIGFEFNTGFDGSYGGIDADLETYLTTIGMKIYALKGRIQPFLHPSIGVMVAKLDVDAPGLDVPFPDQKTTPGLRLGGGVDVYITENLFVSISAYYVLALDKEVEDVQYVPVSGAIGWRF
jgi:opacity protein-like surface antigen